MALKQYLSKNRKKVSVIIAMLLVLIVAVVAATNTNSNTKADVFKDNGDGTYTTRDHVTVLEIVAQYGQQVMGYTVPGSEPISKEQVEAYHGDIDVNDFHDATGYIVTKTGSGDGGCNYTVTGSDIDDAFNKNVLGGSMTRGQVTVVVAQANMVTAEQIESADLVFINSNNYNDNLLYYYDQMVNGGAANIQPGDKGAGYNSEALSPISKYELAIKRFTQAAGRKAEALKITSEDYAILGIAKYKEFNHEAYADRIGSLSKGALTGASNEQTISAIEKVVANVNSSEKATALSYIKKMAGKVDNTEEENDAVIAALEKTQVSNFYPGNREEYLSAIANAVTIPNFSALSNLVATTNTSSMRTAVLKLAAYKTGTEEMPEAGVLTSLFSKFASKSVNLDLLDEYIAYLFSDAFSFSNPSKSTTCVSEIRVMIDIVNAAEKENALTLIAMAPSDEEAYAKLAGNLSKYFGLADIEGSNVYNYDAYLEALGTLEDKTSLQKTVTAEAESSEDENSQEEGQTPTSYVTYDLDAIVAFIAKVNETCTMTYEGKTTDMSWETARQLIEYAIVEERALTYDTQLLTNGDLGDYNTELATNTNNLYKFLLITRQLQGDYLTNVVLNNIDDAGIYYPEGKDSSGNYVGEGRSAWYKYTFTGQEPDYSCIREPEVVGQVYGTDGTTGTSTNYVYKNIYSYTGDQFFGGASFVASNLTELLESGCVITHNAYDKHTEDAIYSSVKSFKRIYLDASPRAWNQAHAYFFGGTLSKEKTITMRQLGTKNERIYYVDVPEGATTVIFKLLKDSWDRQTVDVPLDGQFFSLQNNPYGKVNVSKGIASGITVKDAWLNNASQNNNVWFNNSMTVEVAAVGMAAVDVYRNGVLLGSYPNGTKLTIDGLERGQTVQYDVRYKSISNKNITKQYMFTNVGYALNVTNLKYESEVKYYKQMVVKVEATGVTELKYQINGGTAKSISSGTEIPLGESVQLGVQNIFTLSYKVNGQQRTRNYYFKRVDASMVQEEANYNSRLSATNSMTMPSDPLLSNDRNMSIAGQSKGKILRTIMEFSLNRLQSYPYRILEIEPTASVSVLDNYQKAVEFVEYLQIDMPEGMNETNFREYFQVTSMGIREFNTRNENLVSNYDLIYIGIDSGYQVANKYTVKGKTVYRTYYNDSSLNGLVYTGIGDEYKIKAFLRGTAATDYYESSDISKWNSTHKKEYEYWRYKYSPQLEGDPNASFNLDKSKYWLLKDSSTTTRLLGNDLTVKKMNELLAYVKTGCPILLPDEIFNCDSSDYVEYASNSNDSNAAKWRYVDPYSKMYAFIKEIKSLGYNPTTGQYDGLKNGQPIFSDGGVCSNIVQEKFAASGGNPANMDSAHKFEGGLTYATKRVATVSFKLIEKPQEYSYDKNGNPIAAGSVGTTIRIGETQYSTYRFVLEVNDDVDLQWVKENYNYQVFIDKSGTGRFEDGKTVELIPSISYNERNHTVIVEGRWPGSIDGFIPWKIEAFNKSNVDLKFSYTGFSSFEIPVEKKKDVYILWVKTQYNSTKPSNVDFAGMVQKYQKDINEYNLKLMTISYPDFNDYIWTNKLPNYTDVTTFTRENTMLRVDKFMQAKKNNRYFMRDWNGKLWSELTTEQKTDIDHTAEFNMLVFGYCDSYSSLDIHNMNALNNIEYYLDSGHSILFAHDNASYLTTLNYYINDTNSTTNAGTKWARYSTSFFRHRLGMDVYGCTYPGANFDESSDEYLEYIANTRKYLNTDTMKQEDMRGISEVCTFNYSLDDSNAKLGNRIYADSLHSDKHQRITDWQHTRTVRRINKGQISEYPFVIGEYLPTAITHSQYMNLNMEDEEITVWYTLGYDSSKKLSGSNSPYYMYTDGDGSNNYYIYSKGNITYTGSGHDSSNDLTPLEQQLFINTVVAAIKAGNFDPAVEFPGSSMNGQGESIIYKLEGVKDYVDIDFMPIDYDSENEKDGIFSEVKIYIDLNDDGKYDNGDLLLAGDGVTNSLICDANGNPVNFKGTELLNKVAQHFIIKDSTINDLVAQGKITSIYQHKIGIVVKDYEDDGSVADTYYGQQIRIVESTLHNLN